MSEALLKRINSTRLAVSQGKVRKSLFSESRTQYDKAGFRAKDDGMSGGPALWATNKEACIAYSESDKEYQVLWNIPTDGSEPDFDWCSSGEDAFRIAKSKGMKFELAGITAFTSYLKDIIKAVK